MPSGSTEHPMRKSAHTPMVGSDAETRAPAAVGASPARVLRGDQGRAEDACGAGHHGRGAAQDGARGGHGHRIRREPAHAIDQPLGRRPPGRATGPSHRRCVRARGRQPRARLAAATALAGTNAVRWRLAGGNQPTLTRTGSPGLSSNQLGSLASTASARAAEVVSSSASWGSPASLAWRAPACAASTRMRRWRGLRNSALVSSSSTMLTN